MTSDRGKTPRVMAKKEEQVGSKHTNIPMEVLRIRGKWFMTASTCQKDASSIHLQARTFHAAKTPLAAADLVSLWFFTRASSWNKVFNGIYPVPKHCAHTPALQYWKPPHHCQLTAQCCESNTVKPEGVLTEIKCGGKKKQSTQVYFN